MPEHFAFKRTVAMYNRPHHNHKTIEHHAGALHIQADSREIKPRGVGTVMRHLTIIADLPYHFIAIVIPQAVVENPMCPQSLPVTFSLVAAVVELCSTQERALQQ